MDLFNQQAERKGATLSECGRYRYELYRIWNDNLPFALVVMLNPSTANVNTDDNTINKLRYLLKAAGYGGFYVANLFTYRTSDPAAMKRAERPLAECSDIFAQILRRDYYIVKNMPICRDVVYAWGNDGKYMNQSKYIITAIQAEPLCFGVTMLGEPTHPLFLPKTTKLVKYADALAELK